RSFAVQEVEHDPMAARSDDIAKQVRRPIAIDHDDVDGPVVIQVTGRHAATRSNERRHCASAWQHFFKVAVSQAAEQSIRFSVRVFGTEVTLTVFDLAVGSVKIEIP